MSKVMGGMVLNRKEYENFFRRIFLETFFFNERCKKFCVWFRLCLACPIFMTFHFWKKN